MRAAMYLICQDRLNDTQCLIQNNIWKSPGYFMSQFIQHLSGQGTDILLGDRSCANWSYALGRFRRWAISNSDRIPEDIYQRVQTHFPSDDELFKQIPLTLEEEANISQTFLIILEHPQCIFPIEE